MSYWFDACQYLGYLLYRFQLFLSICLHFHSPLIHSRKMLITFNHNTFQRLSTDFFQSFFFFCMFQLTMCHKQESHGKRVLSKNFLDYVGLILHHLLQDKYHITLLKFCAKLLEIFGCLSFCLEHVMIQTKICGQWCWICRVCLASEMDAFSLVPNLCELLWFWLPD